jgi:pumilio family protein 6
MPSWSSSPLSTVSSESDALRSRDGADGSDTKLMGKAFVSDIVALTPSLASDKNGRRAILYLLTPTSTRHFMPSTLAILSAAAQTARDIGTSKKDPATRRKEIVGYAAPGLLDVVAEKGEELVRDPGAGLLVQEIMLCSTGGKPSMPEDLSETDGQTSLRRLRLWSLRSGRHMLRPSTLRPRRTRSRRTSLKPKTPTPTPMPQKRKRLSRRRTCSTWLTRRGRTRPFSPAGTST